MCDHKMYRLRFQLKGQFSYSDKYQLPRLFDGLTGCVSNCLFAALGGE